MALVAAAIVLVVAATATVAVEVMVVVATIVLVVAATATAAIEVMLVAATRPGSHHRSLGSRPRSGKGYTLRQAHLRRTRRRLPTYTCWCRLSTTGQLVVAAMATAAAATMHRRKKTSSTSRCVGD